MTNPQQNKKPPSKKQLSLLRSLAAERGQSFAYPQTSVEADREIKRLKKGKRLSRTDRAREDRAVREAMSAGRGDASRVRPEELSGYGSTATWRTDRA